jgi:ABC-type transporter Mla subunit MlaD
MKMNNIINPINNIDQNLMEHILRGHDDSIQDLIANVNDLTNGIIEIQNEISTRINRFMIHINEVVDVLSNSLILNDQINRYIMNDLETLISENVQNRHHIQDLYERMEYLT